MKNIILTILVVAALFVFMGCAGQQTTVKTDQTVKNTTQPVQQIPVENKTQTTVKNDTTINTGLITGTGQGKGLASCNPGTLYSAAGGGGSVQGTVVGVETYNGKQACHISYQMPGTTGKYDYYLNMQDASDICFVISAGDSSPPTEICSWE